MAVNLKPPRRLLSVEGVLVGTAAAGMKSRGREDLTLFAIAPDAAVSGVFTRNRFAAAPVSVCRSHLRGRNGVRGMIVNSGIANAGTGATGTTNALETCSLAARALDCRPSQILPFSTGVIIKQLPIERFDAAISKCVSRLAPNNWIPAARAIMTTDTIEKGCSQTVALRRGKATVTGISKGSGMIHPDMATMLAYIATDAPIGQARLDDLVREIVGGTFNEISVDGETSTNDSFVAIATGRLARAPGAADLRRVEQTLGDVAERLALAIVRDGEGATKLITVNVSGSDSRSCRSVAASVAGSPLVKTALHACDANVGRFLMAIGKADAKFAPQRVSVAVNGLPVIAGGMAAPDYNERKVASGMKRAEISLDIDLGGKAHGRARMRTCDLSAEYVRINTHYRT